MKATVFDNKGTKKEEMNLPALFSIPVREDIISKCYLAEKVIMKQPYSSDPEAGKKHSASGTVRHKRHSWKAHYGKGMSRVPRKTMWRRGTQFMWVGAEVSNMRGGRRPHPPKGVYRIPKINAKELKLAFASGLAATVDMKFIKKRYAKIGEVSAYPAILESLPQKTKALLEILHHVFGKSYWHSLQEKKVRSGVGKLRGRTYTSSAGVLIVVGKKEKLSFSGVDVRSADEITLQDLYPLGRLTIYTKQALEELKNVA